MLTPDLKTSQWILLLIPIVWHKELQNGELGHYLWPMSSPYFYKLHCPWEVMKSCCEPMHSIAIFCTTGHFLLIHPVNFILLNGQPLLMTDESVLEPINLNIPFRNPLRLSIFYARWILVHRVKSWSIEYNRFPVFAPHNLYNMPQFLPYNKASFTVFIHVWTNSPTGSLFYYLSNQPEPVNL